jgi:hypothetical protein
MWPNTTCPNPDCPNRGILTLDANTLFFLIEGTISYVQNQYPDLTTKASRLPRILEELDRYLGVIKGRCSLDGDLHISDRVLHEEVLVVDPRAKDLAMLKNYRNVEREQILGVVRDHFPQPTIVPDREIRALRGLFDNPDIRPDDRDASLIVVVCHLATNGLPTIVLTDDPDFVAPIKWLMRQESVILGEQLTFATNRIMYRDYFGFLWQLHDCCSLPTPRYKPLATAYYNALLKRLPDLTNPEVRNRDMERLRKAWSIHTDSIQFKAAGVQARG